MALAACIGMIATPSQAGETEALAPVGEFQGDMGCLLDIRPDGSFTMFRNCSIGRDPKSGLPVYPDALGIKGRVDRAGAFVEFHFATGDTEAPDLKAAPDFRAWILHCGTKVRLVPESDLASIALAYSANPAAGEDSRFMGMGEPGSDRHCDLSSLPAKYHGLMNAPPLVAKVDRVLGDLVCPPPGHGVSPCTFRVTIAAGTRAGVREGMSWYLPDCRHGRIAALSEKPGVDKTVVGGLIISADGAPIAPIHPGQTMVNRTPACLAQHAP